MRSIRRKTVSSETVGSISSDTWLVVCSNLYFSPSCVLKLMKTSKTIWLALQDNPAWWQTFFNRVVLYQSILTRSNCLTVLRELGDRNKKNKRVVIHLVFSTECSGCGARYGHSIFKPLMKRMCQTCIHDSLISNRVLLLKYGIHFSDIVLEYNAKGGSLLLHPYPRPSMTSFLHVTTNVLDLVQKNLHISTTVKKETSCRMVFFVKKDLYRLLGINLDDEYRKTLGIKQAIQVLFACFRRLRTQNIMGKHQKKTLGAEAVRMHEVQRVIHPYRACFVDMVGGAYYSFSAPNASMAHTLPMIKYRAGISRAMALVLNECVDTKSVLLE